MTADLAGQIAENGSSTLLTTHKTPMACTSGNLFRNKTSIYMMTTTNIRRLNYRKWLSKYSTMPHNILTHQPPSVLVRQCSTVHLREHEKVAVNIQAKLTTHNICYILAAPQTMTEYIRNNDRNLPAHLHDYPVHHTTVWEWNLGMIWWLDQS